MQVLWHLPWPNHLATQHPDPTYNLSCSMPPGTVWCQYKLSLSPPPHVECGHLYSPVAAEPAQVRLAGALLVHGWVTAEVSG